MNMQSLKQVQNDYSSYRKRGAEKKLLFLLLTISGMLLLFSCKKSSDELPLPESLEENTSVLSSTANVSTYEESIPYDRTLFVPCGNGGAGEEIALTGTLQFVEQIIYNIRGFTLNYHLLSKGVTGTGLTTGEKFESSGGNSGTITGEFGEEGQYTRIFTTQLRIVGQSSVFTVFYKSKITITPDGKITTRIEEENVDCKE